MAVKTSRPGRAKQAVAKPATPRSPIAAKPPQAARPEAKTEIKAAPPAAAAAPSKVEEAVAKTGAAVEALAAPVRKTAEKVAEVASKAVETVTAQVADTVKAAATTTTDPVAQPTAQSIQKDIDTMNTEAKKTIDAATDKGQAMFADMNDRAKSAMEKNAKMVEEMNELAKGNLEAVVESGRIAAKGMESLGHDAAEFGRKSFEQATATMKNMAQVKSPTELFKLQSDFMRSAFDMYVAEASKTTEQMMKLAGEAAQPLSNRMAVAAEKVKLVA
jgi:phasin family protein